MSWLKWVVWVLLAGVHLPAQPAAAPPNYLELQGRALGEVTAHDAMMLNAHVPRLVERLKRSGQAIPEQVGALIAAGRTAHGNHDYYRAFRLHARAAGLAQGEDKVAAYEVAASLDLSVNRAIFTGEDTITVTLHPLFSLGHPLSGSYAARCWLENEAGAIAGAAQQLAITELKDYRVDFSAQGLADGVTAIGYRLTSPAGALLVEFRQAVFVAQDAQTRLDRLKTRFGALKPHGTAGQAPSVLAALETVAYQIQALEKERTQYDGNWQRLAHPFGMYLGQINFAADGRPPAEFPMFIGRLRYPEDLGFAESLAEGLAVGSDALLKRSGDLQQAYRAADGELVRYRIYVPSGYDHRRQYPLIVALHSGAGEGTYFEWEGFSAGRGDSRKNRFKELAQEKGYIVACPNGRGDFFGERGEADVLAVLDRVRSVYSIDPGRVFLAGWSIGSSASWRIAMRHPQRFNGIAPVGGAAEWLNRDNTEQARSLRILYSTADHDYMIEQARRTGALAKQFFREFTYVEYPDTTHGDVWAKALPNVFAFFDQAGRAGSGGPEK